ncbi:hypothetical protein GCM10007049_34000 [Echinicola pacifica]|uniref:Capsule assembly protein Wzi n=1 Tax=Echinicola pacifica TaxID=346377 RepID=A0A918Q8L4_9BACT|nr:capsule assembly Wzi family protein [Echinicola pacifica]GGZ37939.1 hypothetical protein GCM10007049_34000 [Echinicola pacifica]
MNNLYKIIFTIIGFIIPLTSVWSQTISAGMPVFEEAVRRKQLLGQLDSTLSFNLRPIQANTIYSAQIYNDFSFFEVNNSKSINRGVKKSKSFTLLPLQNSSTFNTGRPYGFGNGAMIPNVGFQNKISAGFAAKFHFLNIQFAPEYVWAQNKSYSGFSDTFQESVIKAKFHYWNHGDNPERFGDGPYSKLLPGQSKISLNYGAFEIGASTENIWWGPGQFNALIISNNAAGFPHLTFNTTKPANTIIGSFEGQIIMGRLESSNLEPSQFDFLNNNYFRNLSTDWRYLNGMTISYQPKWVPGLFLGINRTFQQYRENRTNSFGDLFPIFEAFTKKDLFTNGNSVQYDSKAQDQQVSLFGRYIFQKANAEIYFEYGRRDHAYTIREFVLNPEHARAFLLGFNKIFQLSTQEKYIQVRGEMTHQQESVNKNLRYFYLADNNTSWHAHYQVRGFTNYGESMGVGIGNAGSNIQTIEISLIEKLNKFGIVFERLANHQDFYNRAFERDLPENQPWVDLSLGLLFDYQWDRFMLSSKLQFIDGMNYQWQLAPESTEEYPVGKDKFSVFAQANLIYLIGKKK